MRQLTEKDLNISYGFWYDLEKTDRAFYYKTLGGAIVKLNEFHNKFVSIPETVTMLMRIKMFKNEKI